MDEVLDLSLLYIPALHTTPGALERGINVDPEITQINEQIQLIMLATQADLDDDQARTFAAAASEISTKYAAAVGVLADKNASDTAKKYAKDVTDSINKNLPNLTKGVLSAVSAFKSGDYINGSAAIMDICAVGAQMIGSLSAAAGPYGAAFGAVFTLVGQLLTYFGPKQPSLKDQIIEAIRGMEAETQLQHAKADGDAVTEYAATIYRVRTTLPKHLQDPFVTERNLWDFRTGLKVDLIAINKAFDKISTLYTKWETAEWLKGSKNQDQEKWPEILSAFLRTYCDSALANMALASMANEELVDQRLEDSSSKNPKYKDFSHDFDEVNNLLIDLRATVEALPGVWNDGNRLMLQTLKEIKPVAQDRGLHVQLSTDRYLYAATGRNKLQSSTWKNLPASYGQRGHRFYITVAKPQHHLFLCNSWELSDNGDVEHSRVDPASLDVSGQVMITGDKFSDVCALPAPSGGGATFVYKAHDGGTDGYVKLYELDANNQLTDGNWAPGTKAGVVNIRAITPPPAPLSDDPDKDGMPPGSLSTQGTNHYNSIFYGALRSSPEIYVDQSNTRCYVPSPWESYTGVDVDPYYLWVFRPQGFACATHASVLSCIQGKRQAPRWIEYSLNGLLGDQSTHSGNLWRVNGRETTTYPPLVGLRTLSPCPDGTLFAGIATRSVQRGESDEGRHFLFTAEDSGAMYTTGYRIDIAAGEINVDPWRKCVDADVLQVQKVPIPCWSLFEGVNADLQTKTK